MATGTHRKDAIRAGVPVGEIVTLVLLVAALAGILFTLSAIGTPTYAHASARPAPVNPVASDPFWDGKHPGVWMSWREPKCSDLYAHHVATVRFPDGYQNYMECVPLEGTRPGPDRPWVWQLVTAVRG